MLKPDGVLLANLILDGKLETPYARNLQATIDSVFGRCAVDVPHKGKMLANVESPASQAASPMRPGFTSMKNPVGHRSRPFALVAGQTQPVGLGRPPYLVIGFIGPVIQIENRSF